MSIQLETKAPDLVGIAVVGENLRVPIACTLGEDGPWFAPDPQFRQAVIDLGDRGYEPLPLRDFLRGRPPRFLTATMDRLQGRYLSTGPLPITFDAGRIETIA